MKIEKDWKSFISGTIFVYVVVYVVFKIFFLAFFPGFYFGPLHSLAIMGILLLIAGFIELSKHAPIQNDQILANAALMLISSIVSNGNTLEVPSYIVAATAQKLKDEKIKMEIEEVDGKYIMKVEVK